MIFSKLEVLSFRSVAAVVGGLAFTFSGALAHSQTVASNQKPGNDLPNPYQSVSDWVKLPEGVKWGAVTSVQFDKKGDIDGKFIKTWGTTGSGPGQFNGPHSITFDRKGRLLVADRGNNRIEIFDQDGNYTPSRSSSVALAESMSTSRTTSMLLTLTRMQR
jgi:NHL repeat